MLNEIAFYVIEKSAENTPSFLLRRLITPEKLKGKIDIDLRADRPINFSDNGHVPSITFFLEVVNRSSLNLVLEKVSLEVWFGQPALLGWMLKPVKIPRAERVTGIDYWHILTESQVKLYRWCRDVSDGGITLNLSCYFETKIGTIVMEKRIERKVERQDK